MKGIRRFFLPIHSLVSVNTGGGNVSGVLYYAPASDGAFKDFDGGRIRIIQ